MSIILKKNILLNEILKLLMTIELSIMNYGVVIPVKNILHIITKYCKK
jgi:hypothetical protein